MAVQRGDVLVLTDQQQMMVAEAWHRSPEAAEEVMTSAIQSFYLCTDRGPIDRAPARLIKAGKALGLCFSTSRDSADFLKQVNGGAIRFA
jgi:hypothetical protein